MKKYVLTNVAGETGTGVRIKIGKFVHNAAQHTALLERLTSAAETTQLAVLVSPIVPSNVHLFQVHSWNVAVGKPEEAQNYTVVKEVMDIPRATLELRMTFALRALTKIVANADFREWAALWIAGDDRSAATAKAVRESLEAEQKAGEDLGALAAWGATSSDDVGSIEKMEDYTQRAIHATNAAELVEAGAEKAEQIALEIAIALKNIVRETNKHDLQALATQILENPSAALRDLSDSAAG